QRMVFVERTAHDLQRRGYAVPDTAPDDPVQDPAVPERRVRAVANAFIAGQLRLAGETFFIRCRELPVGGVAPPLPPAKPAHPERWRVLRDATLFPGTNDQAHLRRGEIITCLQPGRLDACDFLEKLPSDSALPANVTTVGEATARREQALREGKA